MSEVKQNLFQYLRNTLDAGLDPVSAEPEIWEQYGKKVAVLVLDSTGFSRVSESHGILHFLVRLVRMRDIVEPILKTNHATLSKFEADNVFAAFEHPDQAIAAAATIHRDVEAAGLMLTDSEPFRVCIGIGYGDLLYSETLEGYFGEEMNLASKLGEDTADGGETLITMNCASAATPELTTAFEKRQVAVSGIDVDYLGLSS